LCKTTSCERMPDLTRPKRTERMKMGFQLLRRTHHMARLEGDQEGSAKGRERGRRKACRRRCLDFCAMERNEEGVSERRVGEGGEKRVGEAKDLR
jgi:hypothetical protein